MIRLWLTLTLLLLAFSAFPSAMEHSNSEGLSVDDAPTPLEIQDIGIEARSSPSVRLSVAAQIDDLTRQADALTESQEFEAAEDALVNALYLLHREEGVTTTQQAPLVARLRALVLSQADYRRADQFSHLAHFISKRQSATD